MKNVTTVLGEVKNLSEYRYFVTMTDTMLSGWGQADNKTAKRVILCKTFRESQIIVSGLNNCKNRNGMRYINIATNSRNIAKNAIQLALTNLMTVLCTLIKAILNNQSNGCK